MFYFVITIFFCSFYLLNLVLAVVYLSYEKEMQSIEHEVGEKKPSYLFCKFLLFNSSKSQKNKVILIGHLRVALNLIMKSTLSAKLNQNYFSCEKLCA